MAGSQKEHPHVFKLAGSLKLTTRPPRGISKPLPKTPLEQYLESRKKRVKRGADHDGLMQPGAKRAKILANGSTPARKYSPAVEAQRVYLEGCKVRRPRFLFRGFGSESGGGVDPRLNSVNGIIPHGFLGGKKPTSMLDNPRLSALINAHLAGSSTILSDFSSWAANISTSISFTVGKSYAYLAVLDTEAMEHHVEIHHVPDLVAAGLARHNYPEEYLVYGPVRGQAFHCVPIARIKNYVQQMGIRSFGYGFVPGYTPPRPLRGLETPFSLARQIGNLFRRDDIASEEMVVTVAAAFLGIHLSTNNSSYSPRESDKAAAIRELAHELGALERRTHVNLVNSNVETYGHAGFQAMIDLLVAFESEVFEAKAQKLKEDIEAL